jgi:hypothetical protein
MTSPPSETVTFAQYQRPGLPAGVYELDVRVRVDGSDHSAISGELASSYRFAVHGDRFALSDPAGTISALYPQDNATGEFDATFPHVVLTKPRLPWSRYPTHTPPEPDPGVPTWLAVLVLDDTDVADPEDLVPAASTVGDLFPAALGPGLHSYFSYAGAVPELDPGQAPTDAIMTLDLPLTLFTGIAPTLADLALTAHVRTVSILNTPPAAGAAPPAEATGTFSVVVSNRLPQGQLKSHAYLVSLEGLATYLPTADGGPGPDAAAGGTIRLAVLAHWTFFSAGSPARFDDQLQGLDGPDPANPAAARTGVRLERPGATGVVAAALQDGYVPLDHKLRVGGQTVSWYRGPLSATTEPATTGSAGPPPLPITSPDAVTAFDPTTGMLDVSLAAAWTLGRMLALDDTTFSTTLYNWKQGLKRAIVTAAEARLIEQEFGPLAASDGAVNAAALPLLHHAMSLLARSEPS